MKIEISIKKNGNILAQEVIADPHQGDLAASIGRVFDQARNHVKSPLWECEIDVRQVD